MTEIRQEIKNTEQFYKDDAKSMWQSMGVGLGIGGSFSGIEYYRQKKYLNSLEQDTVDLSSFVKKISNESKKFIENNKSVDKFNIIGKGTVIATITGIICYSIMLINNWNKAAKREKELKNNK